ncbi:MAG TPA: glycoside hydrolase family 172 protein [Planctomycetota bacterium]
MALENLSRMRLATRRRESSYQRDGGNHDYKVVAPGAAHCVGELAGPGVIRHVWMTALGDDPDLLRTASLRIWWDGAAEPSVDVPLGDFFGAGFGQTANFASLPLSCMPQAGKGMNCWFPMPFRSGARIEVLNEGAQPLKHLFYYVDWESVPALDPEEAYFHAWFARENPCQGISDQGMSNWDYQMEGHNVDGAGNFVLLDFAGRGHYVGSVVSIHNLRVTDQNNWYGEGDDMIFLDGDARPTLHGTGTEDYFCTAWGPRESFCGPYAGLVLAGGENFCGRNVMYRFHVEDPVHFQREIRVTIEHGHANRRSDDWSSVAYWYAAAPGTPRQARVAVADRIPYPAEHLPGLPCIE